MTASRTWAATTDAETRERAECGASLIVRTSAAQYAVIPQQGMQSSRAVSGRKTLLRSAPILVELSATRAIVSQSIHEDPCWRNIPISLIDPAKGETKAQACANACVTTMKSFFFLRNHLEDLGYLEALTAAPVSFRQTEH